MGRNAFLHFVPFRLRRGGTCAKLTGGIWPMGRDWELRASRIDGQKCKGLERIGLIDKRSPV